MANICTSADIKCPEYNHGFCNSIHTCKFSISTSAMSLLDKYPAINWQYLTVVLDNQKQIMERQEQILSMLKSQQQANIK